MREIKFKAKRVDNGEWVYGFYWVQILKDGRELYYIVTNDQNNQYGIEVIPETVCQFTGLKDKNGVDIYEFDHFGNTNLPVLFHSGCFCLGSLRLKGYLNGEYMEQVDQIIGNIHD